MPVVAQTVADFCERPIAKALGIEVSITQTRGLGRLACTQRRSMIPCSSGASAGETSFAPSVARAILSEANSWAPSSTTRDHDDDPGAGADGEEHADEHDVDEPEQEQRQQHPRLQAGVFAEVRSRGATRRGLSQKRDARALKCGASDEPGAAEARECRKRPMRDVTARPP